MDLSALRLLGFDTSRDFQNDLRKLGSFEQTSGGEHGVWIVDTQALFSGWLKRKSQIGLERACKEIELSTKRLHNAGNDARCAYHRSKPACRREVAHESRCHYRHT